jgi:hypothetical protein
MFGPQQGIIQQSADTQGYGAICDVEDIPIVPPEIKVKKVGNPAISEPIDQISNRSPDHKAETDGQRSAMGGPEREVWFPKRHVRGTGRS